MRQQLQQLRGELREARRTAEEARNAENFYRQQLDAKAGANVSVTNVAALGVIGEIRTLRESMASGNSFATKTEIDLFKGLIQDARELIGGSRALDTAENLCADSSPYRSNILTTLSQLEALATSRGALPRQELE